MIADGGPFRATDDTNVFHRQNGKKEIFVCPVIPILVIHDDGCWWGRHGEEARDPRRDEVRSC